MATTAHNLTATARAIFTEALRAVDAGRAVREVVRVEDARLIVAADQFELHEDTRVYAIGLGKAAGAMAAALSDVLGARLTQGVVTTPLLREPLPAHWQVFAGGHPLPNEASLAAGHAARALLRTADTDNALVFFLVSGGGSAMMELPRDERVTLSDLRTTNRVLVACGATIAEINTVRRALSAIKGGGLAALAPCAAHISLIISDTNPHEAAHVASGPTYAPDNLTSDVAAILERYELRAQLPPTVLHALAAARAASTQPPVALRRHHVLLDNECAKDAAAQAARARGCVVELCHDLIEAPVAAGCRELVARLLRLRREATDGRAVCLISGGEFVCPVRGAGVGGRNLEAALHTAVEFEQHATEVARAGWHVAALHAGTDGLDGNSPATGACADDTTIKRARTLNLDAADFLARSDAYNFFRPLGDTIETGPTGTNVRDLRILLAAKKL